MPSPEKNSEDLPDRTALQDKRALDWSALTSVNFAGAQIAIIVGLAVAVIATIEFVVRALQIPSYVFPPPSEIFGALLRTFPLLWPHLLVTLQELGAGYAIGALVGILLAAIITQFPFMEKVVTPYIPSWSQPRCWRWCPCSSSSSVSDKPRASSPSPWPWAPWP